MLDLVGARIDPDQLTAGFLERLDSDVDDVRIVGRGDAMGLRPRCVISAPKDAIALAKVSRTLSSTRRVSTT
ncbi:MAG: hypothetical protein MK133_17840, partial [Planctomycetes bacterium]|nr:hypothetical protein [Planctomycetota bacterium]